MSETDTKQLKDVTLICKECGEPFNFSAKEQQFYIKQGFEHVPTRCYNCRKEARERRDKGTEYFPVKCAISGKVGRLPIKPDDPTDVYSEEAFNDLFAQKGNNIDPLAEPDKTDLLEEVKGDQKIEPQAPPNVEP